MGVRKGSVCFTQGISDILPPCAKLKYGWLGNTAVRLYPIHPLFNCGALENDPPCAKLKYGRLGSFAVCLPPRSPLFNVAGRSSTTWSSTRAMSTLKRGDRGDRRPYLPSPRFWNMHDRLDAVPRRC